MDLALSLSSRWLKAYGLAYIDDRYDHVPQRARISLNPLIVLNSYHAIR